VGLEGGSEEEVPWAENPFNAVYVNLKYPLDYEHGLRVLVLVVGHEAVGLHDEPPEGNPIRAVVLCDVDYDLGLWYLTPKGEEYARQIAERETDERFNEFVALAQRIASRLNQTRNNKARASRADVTDKSQSFIAEFTEKPDKKQQGNRASVAACVLQSLKDRLTDEEMEVVMEMLSHYTMYGVTYMYMDQLAERLKADYEWLIRRVRDLQSKGIVYIYTDPRLGIRVGFSKVAKEVLATCGHGR